MDYSDGRKLAALRELLDPRLAAAWFDEVESYRKPRHATPLPVERAGVPAPKERIFTVNQLSDYLGVSRTTIYRLFKDDDGLPVVKIGRSVRIRESDVAHYLERHRGSI